MNACNRNYGCLSCDNGCNDKCTEAAYRCDFDITAAPYDPTTWNVTWCGKLHKVKIPPIAETDTTLSTNYSNATLNYAAEKHEDVLTGEQLGSLIRVGDLRDTNCDYTTEAMCYELIYHKYGECGDGCMSLENEWATFSIDNEGALRPQIHYVRGANVFGCPEYLNVPSNTNEYWFAGWRGEPQDFGYYQATKLPELPEDSNGNYIISSQYPSNKQPVVSVLPWKCMMTNIFGNLGVDVQGAWRGTGTSGFYATFDQIQGYFSINWKDWNDLAETQLAGTGKITGKVNWVPSFDIKTGTMQYNITEVYYDTMTWTVEQGVTGPTAPTLHLYGIPLTGGSEVDLIPNGVTFGKSNVSYSIDKEVSTNTTIQVAPGQVVGPMDFVRIWVDWVNDDNGFLGVQFSSKLSGWQTCAPGEF